MKSSKSFKDFENARKRGANINMLILEMRANNYDNDEIQKIINSEHPSPDMYLVDMKGLIGNIKTREIDYRELYEDCKIRLAMLESIIKKYENEPRRILKASKRSREEENTSEPSMMDQLQERIRKRQKSSSIKKIRSSGRRKSVKKKSVKRKSVKRKSTRRKKSINCS